MVHPFQVILGLGLSSVVSVMAYRRSALTLGGTFGAVITGTVIFGFGGWSWGLLLITFFVLSTLLSMYKGNLKLGLAEKFAKGSRRDLGQVFANAGVGTILALASPWSTRPWLICAFTGAMAAVNADTWATELGVLAKHPPRLITTGKPVEPGTSGGVSFPGVIATLIGGTTIAVASVLYLTLDRARLDASAPGNSRLPTAGLLVLAGAIAGLAGSLFDSLLGATVQAVYYSHVRCKETERAIDLDGTPNDLVRGWRWLNNDWVNFLSSIVGALTCVGAYSLLA